MKPLIRFVLFAALVGIFAHDGQAQPVPQFRAFAGNPTGYCGGPLSFAVDSTTGNWWTCDNHVYVQPASGGGPPTGAAGGDLSGTYPNPTVAGLEAVPFCTGFTPTNGQAVEYTTGSSPNPCWAAVTITVPASSVTYTAPGSVATNLQAFLSVTQTVNCGGVNDTAAIQGALTAVASTGGHVVLQAANGTCMASHIVVSSNTWLDVPPGINVQQSSGGPLIFLQNYSSNNGPQRTVSDGAITAGSYTFTSATANFTSADLGRTIQIAGANATGYIGSQRSVLSTIYLMTSIAAVNSSTSVTLSIPAVTTVSGAATNIFSIDSNIRVSGGNWILYSANTFNMCFHHVSNLEQYGATFASSSNNPYAISLADATYSYVHNDLMNNTYADGVHPTGPLTSVTISDITLTSTATMAGDVVGVTSIDYPTYDTVPLDGCHGNIKDLLIERIHINAKGEVLVDGGLGTILADVTIRDIYDTSTGIENAVIISDNPGASGSSTVISGVLIENIHGNNPVVSAAPSGGGNITIRNVFSTGQLSDDTCGVVCFAIGGEASPTVWDSAIVEDVQIAAGSGAGGGGLNVINAGSANLTKLSMSHIHISSTTQNTLFFSNSSGTTTGTLIGNDLQLDRATGGNNNAAVSLSGTISRAQFSNVRVSDTTTGTLGDIFKVFGTVGNLQISNAEVDCINANSDNFLNFTGTATVTSYELSNVSLQPISSGSCNSVMYYQASSSVGPGMISSLVVNSPGGGRVASVYSNADVTLNGMNIIALGAQAFYVNGATLTIRGSGANSTGSWNGILRQASETVHVINPEYRADISQLAQTAGDKAMNTNTSYGPVAPMISDGTNWRPLAGGFHATTGSIGGSALTAGQCSTGTVTINGANTGMVANASAVTSGDPGAGFTVGAQVTSSNTVTVSVCAIIAGTPTASTYAVTVD